MERDISKIAEEVQENINYGEEPETAIEILLISNEDEYAEQFDNRFIRFAGIIGTDQSLYYSVFGCSKEKFTKAQFKRAMKKYFQEEFLDNTWGSPFNVDDIEQVLGIKL